MPRSTSAAEATAQPIRVLKGDLAEVATTSEQSRSAKTRPTVRPPLPATNVDVALVDINDFETLARQCKSWIHQEVAAGRAPQPVIRRPRCTRWRLSDVRQYLIDRAEEGAFQSKAGEPTIAKAKKASAAAKAARAERAAATANITGSK